MLERGCGHAVKSGGNADANIDFLSNEVYETVNAYLAEYQSSLTQSRDGRFVIGYSDNGPNGCLSYF